MLVIGAAEIGNILTPALVIDALREAFKAPIEVPVRHHHSIPRGADETATLSADGNVVSHNDSLDTTALLARVGHRSASLLGSKTKVEAVACVVVDDHDNTGVVVDQVDTGANLSGRGRGKDVTRNASGKHALANKAGLGRLVAGTTTRDDGHLLVVVRRVIHDLVLRIAVKREQQKEKRESQQLHDLNDLSTSA